MTGLLVAIFGLSLVLLLWAGPFLVDALLRIARFLGWHEFVVAFIVIAVVGTLPNLSVGISSVIHDVPELSFGDVVGGSIIDLTLGVAIAAIIAGGIPVERPLIRKTSLVTAVVAVLPIALIADGILGRVEGGVLIGAFILYILWLFQNRRDYTDDSLAERAPSLTGIREFLFDIGRILVGIVVLLIAAEGVVQSTSQIAISLGVPFYIAGIFVVAVGNSLPEVYFAAIAARQGERDMVLGDLMGSIIAPSTLVLGIVAMLNPIVVSDAGGFLIARLFLVAGAITFFFAVRSGARVTRREAIMLFFVYALFLAAELINQAM